MTSDKNSFLFLGLLWELVYKNAYKHSYLAHHILNIHQMIYHCMWVKEGGKKTPVESLSSFWDQIIKPML